MKRIFGKKLFGIPMAVIAVILIASIALAAWGVTNLTSTGSITMTQEPPPPDYSYTVEPTVLDFGATGVYFGQPISVTSAAITVTNTGNQTINGIDVVVDEFPLHITDSSSDVVGTPIAPLGTATVTVTLTGTAPDVAPPVSSVIDLSVITATLTPE